MRDALGSSVALAARHHERASEPEPQRVTLSEVRERLQALRSTEEARYEHARVERAHLTRIAQPPTGEQALASARKEIQARVGAATRFTDLERAALTRLAKGERSWNPLVRNAARKEAENLHAGQRSRFEAELGKAMRDFETGDARRIQERILSDERAYGEYARASLGLEEQMRQARIAMREQIPKVETQLRVLERAGIARVQCEGAVRSTPLDSLTRSVSSAYEALPKAGRRDIEFAIRRERRALDRTRPTISMDR